MESEQNAYKWIHWNGHEVQVPVSFDVHMMSLVVQRIQQREKLLEEIGRYQGNPLASFAELVKHVKAQIIEGRFLLDEGFVTQSSEDFYARVRAFLARKEGE